jgi:hypothetical protein
MSDVTTQSFAGVIAPPDVRDAIINKLVDGSPFAASLTRDPTSRRAVAYPTAEPTGWAWIPELGRFPEVALGDDALIVDVRKVGGTFKVSNESANDSLFDVPNWLSGQMRDSLARDLDFGLLFGEGAPAPDGIVALAPSVDGADLLAAVATALGEIGDAGGTPDTLAMSATALAVENTRTAADGHLMYSAGFAATVGLRSVVVPGLTPPLVYDSTRCFFVLNGPESEVAVDKSVYFLEDATAVRIKTRCAGAIPAPNKAIRKLNIGGNGTQAAAASGAAKSSSASKSA